MSLFTGHAGAVKHWHSLEGGSRSWLWMSAWGKLQDNTAKHHKWFKWVRHFKPCPFMTSHTSSAQWPDAVSGASIPFTSNTTFQRWPSSKPPFQNLNIPQTWVLKPNHLHPLTAFLIWALLLHGCFWRRKVDVCLRDAEAARWPPRQQFAEE